MTHKLKTKIKKISCCKQPSCYTCNAHIKQFNCSLHIPVEHSKYKKRKQPPAKRTLQTQNPLIIKRQMFVIPPNRSEQLQHKLSRKKLKSRSTDTARKIERYIIVLNRSEYMIRNKYAETINYTERHFGKSSVFPAFELNPYDNALHCPAAEAVNKKPQCQLTGIHPVKAIHNYNPLYFKFIYVQPEPDSD